MESLDNKYDTAYIFKCFESNREVKLEKVDKLNRKSGF